MTKSTVEAHREDAPQALCCGVITASDSRTLQTDAGGQLVVELLEQAGHAVSRREIIPDEPTALRQLIGQMRAADIEVILITGGTGIASRDWTHDTVSSLLTKPIPGYGELFRMLSFEEIGAAAILSRAVGGVCDRSLIFTMPGSPAGVRLAMERLIVPELPHLVRELRR
ncbi:MAG: molybdenum cofactor biosynthesis protein B [Pirellulales bacterium]